MRATAVTAEFGYEDDGSGGALAPITISCDVESIVTSKADDWAVIRAKQPLADTLANHKTLGGCGAYADSCCTHHTAPAGRAEAVRIRAQSGLFLRHSRSPLPDRYASRIIGFFGF